MAAQRCLMGSMRLGSLHRYSNVLFQNSAIKNGAYVSSLMRGPSGTYQQARWKSSRGMGASIEKELRDEIVRSMERERRAPTFEVSEEELAMPVDQLSFDQVYRRVMRLWEERKVPPLAMWLRMVEKTTNKAEFDQLILYCKVLQHKNRPLSPDKCFLLSRQVCKIGLVDEVFKLMKDQNLRFFPSKAGIAAIIEAYCEKDALDKAIEVIALQTKRETPLSPLAYGHLEQAMVRKGLVDQAIRTLEVHRKAGIKGHPKSYSHIMAALDEAGDSERIHQLWSWAKDDAAAEYPPVIAYAVKALQSSGNEDAAREVAKSAKPELVQEILKADGFKEIKEEWRTAHGPTIQRMAS